MSALEEFTIELEDGSFAFCPGELLRGSLMLTLNEPMEMDHMKLQLLGQARFYSHRPVTEANKKDKNKPYGSPSKEELVNLEIILFGNKPEDSSSYIPCHPAGSFGYLFEFPLPTTLPASFESPDDHILGTIRYKVTAMIFRPRKSRLQTFIPIIINEGISPDDSTIQFRPGCETQVEAGDTCFPSGFLSVEGYLEKGCYVQGEDMFITATARNETSRVMNSVYAKLFKRTRYRSKESTKTFMDDIAASFGKLVRPRKFVHWDKMKFPIPMTTPTITRSKVIQVDYFLRVGMFEQFGKEAHIDLPIVIGTLRKDTDVADENRPKVLLARSSDLSKNYWRVTNVGPRTTIEYIKSVARKPEETEVQQNGSTTINDEIASPEKNYRRSSKPSIADQSVDQLIDDIQQDIDRQKRQLADLGSKPSQREGRRESDGGSPTRNNKGGSPMRVNTEGSPIRGKPPVLTSPDKTLELIGQKDGSYKVIAHKHTSPKKAHDPLAPSQNAPGNQEEPNTKAPTSFVQPLSRDAEHLGTDVSNSPVDSPERQHFSPYNSQLSLTASPQKKAQQADVQYGKPFELWGTGPQKPEDSITENPNDLKQSSPSKDPSSPSKLTNKSTRPSSPDKRGPKSESPRKSGPSSQSPTKENKGPTGSPRRQPPLNDPESDSVHGLPDSYLTGSYPSKQEQKPKDPKYPMKDQKDEDQSVENPNYNYKHPDAKFPEKVRFATNDDAGEPEANISSSGHPYRYYAYPQPNNNDDNQYPRGKWDSPAQEPNFATPVVEYQLHSAPRSDPNHNNPIDYNPDSDHDERDGQRARSLSPTKGKRGGYDPPGMKGKGKQAPQDHGTAPDKRHHLVRSRSLSPSHHRNQTPLYPTENLRLPRQPRPSHGPKDRDPPRSRPYPSSRADQHDGPRRKQSTEEKKNNRSRSSSPPRTGPKEDDGRRNNFNDIIVNDVIIYGKREKGSPPRSALKRSQSTKTRPSPSSRPQEEDRPTSAGGQTLSNRAEYPDTPRYTTQNPAGKVSFGDFDKEKKNPKPRTYILPPGQEPQTTDDDTSSAKEIYYFKGDPPVRGYSPERGEKRPYKETSFADDQPQEYSSPRPGQEDFNASPRGSPTGDRPVKKKTSITVHMSPTRQYQYQSPAQVDGAQKSPQKDPKNAQDNANHSPSDVKHTNRNGTGPVTITVGPRVVYGSQPPETKYEKLYGPAGGSNRDRENLDGNQLENNDARYPQNPDPRYGYPGQNRSYSSGGPSGGRVSPGFESKPLRTSSPYGTKDNSYGHDNYGDSTKTKSPLKIEAASYPSKITDNQRPGDDKGMIRGGKIEGDDFKDTKPKAYVISSITPIGKKTNDTNQKSSPKMSRIPVAVQSPPTTRYSSGGSRTYYPTSSSSGSRYNRDGLRYDDFSTWYERLYDKPKTSTARSWSYGPSKRTYSAVRPTRY